MKVKVILSKDVPTLGVVGEIVEVPAGYARNFLMPSGMGMPWSEDAVLRIEKAAKEAEVERMEMAAQYEALAERVSSIQLTFEEKVNAEGALYGAVNAKRIHSALTEQGIDLPESHVRLAEPMRAAGEYEVPIHIHAELNANIVVWVVALEQEGEEVDIAAMDAAAAAAEEAAAAEAALAAEEAASE